MVDDGISAQDDVAEEAAAKMSHRRHHPAHAEQCPELFRVTGRVRSGTDHLLKRDDVRVDRPDDVGDPRRQVRPSRPRQRWML